MQSNQRVMQCWRPPLHTIVIVQRLCALTMSIIHHDAGENCGDIGPTTVVLRSAENPGVVLPSLVRTMDGTSGQAPVPNAMLELILACRSFSSLISHIAAQELGLNSPRTSQNGPPFKIRTRPTCHHDRLCQRSLIKSACRRGEGTWRDT